MSTCDQCGPAVQALYRVRKDDMQLTLCSHHLNANLVQLLIGGWTVAKITYVSV